MIHLQNQLNLIDTYLCEKETRYGEVVLKVVSGEYFIIAYLEEPSGTEYQIIWLEFQGVKELRSHEIMNNIKI